MYQIDAPNTSATTGAKMRVPPLCTRLWMLCLAGRCRICGFRTGAAQCGDGVDTPASGAKPEMKVTEPGGASAGVLVGGLVVGLLGVGLALYGDIWGAKNPPYHEWKTPKDLQAAVGSKVPKDLTVHGMQLALLERVPSLKQYGYAKLADQILVIDPMKKEIITVLPSATGGASTSGSNAPMEPAGDSGDKKNGGPGTTNKQ